MVGGEVLSPNLSFSAVEVEFSNSFVRDRVKKTNRYCLERDIIYGKLFSSVTNWSFSLVWDRVGIFDASSGTG